MLLEQVFKDARQVAARRRVRGPEFGVWDPPACCPRTEGRYQCTSVRSQRSSVRSVRRRIFTDLAVRSLPSAADLLVRPGCRCSPASPPPTLARLHPRLPLTGIVSVVRLPQCQTEASAIACSTLERYLLTCFESVSVRTRCGISLNQSSLDFGRLDISSSMSSSRSRPFSAGVSGNSTRVSLRLVRRACRSYAPDISRATVATSPCLDPTARSHHCFPDESCHLQSSGSPVVRRYSRKLFMAAEDCDNSRIL